MKYLAQVSAFVALALLAKPLLAAGEPLFRLVASVGWAVVIGIIVLIFGGGIALIVWLFLGEAWRRMRARIAKEDVMKVLRVAVYVLLLAVFVVAGFATILVVAVVGMDASRRLPPTDFDLVKIAVLAVVVWGTRRLATKVYPEGI